jgi:hypothetical protein
MCVEILVPKGTFHLLVGGGGDELDVFVEYLYDLGFSFMDSNDLKKNCALVYRPHGTPSHLVAHLPPSISPRQCLPRSLRRRKSQCVSSTYILNVTDLCGRTASKLDCCHTLLARCNGWRVGNCLGGEKVEGRRGAGLVRILGGRNF